MWPWRHSPWERVQKARSEFWCRCDAMQHWGKATLTSAILAPQDPSGLSSTANQSEKDSQKELDTKQWDVSTATDRAEGWWTLSGTDTPARRGSLPGCLTAVTKHSGRWLLGCWSTDNLRESWYQQQTLERLMAYYTKIHIFSLSGSHIIHFSLISRWWGEQPAVERKRQCLKSHTVNPCQSPHPPYFWICTLQTKIKWWAVHWLIRIYCNNFSRGHGGLTNDHRLLGYEGAVVIHIFKNNSQSSGTASPS